MTNVIENSLFFPLFLIFISLCEIQTWDIWKKKKGICGSDFVDDINRYFISQMDSGKGLWVTLPSCKDVTDT